MNSTNSTEFDNGIFPSGDTPERFINIYAAIYEGILSVIGSVGNTIVLYVYLFKFKQNTFNTFIIFLALSDIVCCIIEMPLDVVNLVHPVGFPGCKPIVFIATTMAMGTGLMLVAIAVLRYKGICRPLKPNISVAQARLISSLSLGAALAISWPSAVMITNVLDELNDGIVVMNCAANDDYKDTLYPLIFNGILFLIFFTSFVILIVLYGIIGRRLWLRKKYGPTMAPTQADKSFKLAKHVSKEFPKNVSKYTVNNEVINNVPDACPGKYCVTKETSKLSTCFVKSDIHHNPQVERIEAENGSNSSTASNSSASQLVSNKRNPNKSSKTFKMLFIVTLTFLLSYLPHLTLMIYEALGGDLDVTPLGESVVGIVIRSYLINSVSNPIIYGCCNKKFRAELHDILQRMKRCLHST